MGVPYEGLDDISDVSKVTENAFKMLDYAKNTNWESLNDKQKEGLISAGINQANWSEFGGMVQRTIASGKLSNFLDNTDENINSYKFDGKSELSAKSRQQLVGARVGANAAVFPNDGSHTVFLSPSFYNGTTLSRAQTIIHEFSHFDTPNSNGTVTRGTRDPGQNPGSKINTAKNFARGVYWMYLDRTH